MDILRMRLEALSTDGLNAPSMNPEYICRYTGSLVGKHFTSLAQLLPFAVYDLVPPHILQAWNTIGELVVQLWHTEIEDIEKYLVTFRLSPVHPPPTNIHFVGGALQNN